MDDLDEYNIFKDKPNDSDTNKESLESTQCTPLNEEEQLESSEENNIIDGKLLNSIFQNSENIDINLEEYMLIPKNHYKELQDIKKDIDTVYQQLIATHNQIDDGFNVTIDQNNKLGEISNDIHLKLHGHITAMANEIFDASVKFHQKNNNIEIEKIVKKHQPSYSMRLS